MSASLQPEWVSDRPSVALFTAPNAGPKTLSGTHTYVVGCDPCYVIDPGPVDDEYGDALVAWLRKTKHRPAAILLSHFHPDHAPGSAHLRTSLGVPVLASEVFDEHEAGLHVDRRYLPSETFPVEGDFLQVIATPGHSHDHVAFWLPVSRILFSGDTVLGHGSALVAPPEGEMFLYMKSLEVMRRLLPQLIAPGHGPIVHDPDAKIEEYVRHRTERERGLLAMLESGPATARELVEQLYVDVDPRLHELALGSVLAQLAKLELEKRVISDGERFARV